MTISSTAPGRRTVAKLGPGVKVALYVRISRDAEGLELGVGRQREDLEALVVETGCTLVRVYQDNDKSASKSSGKVRDQYLAMLAAARRSEFDVIMAYSSSRLVRQVLEFEEIIILAEQTGLQLHFLKSPPYDLNTADGKLIARLLVAMDTAEPDRITERVKRAKKQRRDSGLMDPAAEPAFGYADNYYLEADPVQHRALVKVFKLVATGQNAARAGDYLREQFPDRRWDAPTVHRMLRRSTYAGLMLNSSGELITANNVKPLITPELWHSAQTVLDQSRQLSRRPAREFLLSGKVMCGVCGCRMVAQSTWIRQNSATPKPAAWECRKRPGVSACGSMSRTMEAVDALVDAFVRARIAQGDAVTASAAPVDSNLAAEITRLEAVIAETRELVLSGSLSPKDGAEQTAAARDRVSALQKVERGAQAAAVRLKLTAQTDTLAVWSDPEPSALPARQAILAAYLSMVVIHKPVPQPGEKRKAASIRTIQLIPT